MGASSSPPRVARSAIYRPGVGYRDRRRRPAPPQLDHGAKITIDSATMINKAFEIIEARWLFGIGAERITPIVHPNR